MGRAISPVPPAAPRPAVVSPSRIPICPDDGDELAGDRTEAMLAPPADFLAHAQEYLDAEELAPDEVVLDEADVLEDAAAIEAPGSAQDEATARPSTTIAELRAMEPAASDTIDRNVRAIRATIDGALESIAAEEAAQADTTSPAPREAPPSDGERALAAPQRQTDPPAMTPAPRRTDPPTPVAASTSITAAPTARPPAAPAQGSDDAGESTATIEPPVQTPRMAGRTSEPAPNASTPSELPRTTLPMLPRLPRPSPVPLPPADETTPTGRLAIPPPRVPARPAPREEAAPRSQRPGTDPMFRMPQAVAQAPAPEPAKPRREGTDPMMRIAPPPAPPEVEPPSEPTGQLRRRERTDPMIRIVAPNGERTASSDETTPAIARRREGTDPMMKLPSPAPEPAPAEAAPRPREGTDPMMRAPEAHTPRVAAIPKPIAPPSGSMTGAFAIPPAPEAVLPFRARTGTIPPERPQASDLAGVLPFRPAGWGQPALPQHLGEPGDGHARMTPADPMPASQVNPAYVPPPAPQGMHAPNPAYVPPPAPQGMHAPNPAYVPPPPPQGMHAPNPAYVPPPAPQGAVAPSQQGYAPAPVAQLAPVESPSSLSLRRDHLSTGPVSLSAAMHDALPFHGGGAAHPGAHAPAPSASPSYPAPAQQAAPYPPVPQPLAAQGHPQPSYAQPQPGAPGHAVQVQAPAPPAAPPPQPAGPPPRPGSLPSDSWKLAPAGALFPLAPPAAAHAVQEARMAAASRVAAQSAPQAQMSSQTAQSYSQAQAQAPSYAQKPAVESVPVPASLGLNTPRLSLEQYACMAAELALSPANPAQVRQRYGLDDTAHLAEQGLWQRRFSLDSQLFASYSSLFQHYRDWLNQNGRR